MRRVAMISEHANPVALLGGVDAGGQNVYVDAVSRGVAEHGYEVDVFTVRSDPDQPAVVDLATGVRVIAVNAGPAITRDKDALWPYMPDFRDGIDRFQVSDGRPYGLLHGNFWMSGWVAAELSIRWSIPVVEIFHATGMTKAREQGAADTSPVERIDIERMVVTTVDCLIAQCPAEQDELLRDYGAHPDRVVLIPSAVDTDKFRPMARDEARNRLGCDPAAEMIVYVGRVIPRKDIRNVVRALALVVRRRAPGERLPTLFVVGGETEHPDPVATPEIAELRTLAAELEVAEQVRFVGRRQADELRAWYAAANVAVTTPWYEPFGLTPLEAMACATPVIGSRVGGIAFTVVDGETGFLVPPRDPDALATRLDTLLRDRALQRRLGGAGRTRVMREFTWPLVAQRTAELYAALGRAPTTLASRHLRKTSSLPGAIGAGMLQELRS